MFGRCAAADFRVRHPADPRPAQRLATGSHHAVAAVHRRAERCRDRRRVFALRGIGSVAIAASGSSDIQVIMGVLLFTVLIVVGVNLVVDILYGALNPKVRVR